MLNATKSKIQPSTSLKDVSIVIASSEPKEYLGTYMVAFKSGMKLSVDPQIAEEFKAKLMPVLENEIKEPEKRKKEIPGLSHALFEADKRGTEIIRTLEKENGKSIEAQKKEALEMEMCF